MLCVNKLTNLVFNAKKINAKHNLLPFYFLFFLFEKNKKQPRMKCNANPRNKETKNQRTMVTKSRAMKHKDHVKKTQFD